MSDVYVKVEEIRYTEVVYLNAEGEELDRYRRDDDMLYDATEPVRLTEEERTQWIEEGTHD